jgi:SAM-dependent methyltransferase
MDTKLDASLNSRSRFLDKEAIPVIDRLLNSGERKRILDVGCGAVSQITVLPDAYVAGLDLDGEALQKNARLNERICADVQDYSFEPDSFDVVICCCVLEHLRDPLGALLKISRALRKHGIIIIVVPYVYSIIGILTKCTPLWLHIWVTRHLYGSKDAEKSWPKHFKTFMRFSLSPASLKRIAARAALGVEYEYLGRYAVTKDIRTRFYKGIWYIVRSIFQVFSLGRIIEKGDYYLILKKG